MFRNKFIFLVMMFILFAGAVSSVSDLGGGWCGCTSCVDCTNALNNNTHCGNGSIANGSVFIAPISCIILPVNFSNKVFDLNGTKLLGAGGGAYDYGIQLQNNTNITIANGTIEGFRYNGIFLQNVTYADVHNITINATNNLGGVPSGSGIFLGVLAVMDAYTSNSIIYNCSVVNNHPQIPGIYLSYCDGNEIWDTTTSSNGYGIWVRNSWNNQIHDSIADNNVGVAGTGFYCWGTERYPRNNTFIRVNATSNTFGGMLFSGCPDSTVDYGRFISNAEGIVLSLGVATPVNHNVTVSNNMVTGSTSMGIHVDDTGAISLSASRFLNNRILNTTGVAVNFTNTDNNTLINNLVRETSGPSGDAFYFALSADNNTLIENTANNNTGTGFFVVTSEDNTLINSTAYDNYGHGIYLAEADDTFLNHTVLYNNTASDLLIHADAAFYYSGEQFFFFNPAGTPFNYTNLSLQDTLVGTDEYSINWTTNSTALPVGMMSFENKFVDISILNGGPVINSAVWHWLDSEALGYMEAQFEVWKFSDATNTWSDEGATLDLAANTLTITNLDPSSDYGILQNLSSCVEITSPGTYQLSANLTGAPISAAPLVGTTCIKIASSDVLFDCGGYSITNNGTVSITRAISVNESTNVTVQNCPSLSQYTYGVQTYYTSYSKFTNIIAHNNSARGIYLDDSDHLFLAHSIFHNNSGQIMLTNATYSNFTNNSAYDGSGDGFHIENAEYSIFRDNTAYNCSAAFYLESDDLTFYNTTAYGSSFGFYFDSVSRINSTNATLFSNLAGSFGGIIDEIRLRDTHLYNNTLLGDVYMSALAANADLYFANLIIDNPFGNYENYTNLSLYDSMATGNSLVMKWTTNSTALPGGTRSFEQKFVDISTLSTLSIDRISWRWLASEEAGYTPSIFNLVKYNASDGWSVINNTPDTVGRTLAQYNMDPTSDYGILEFVSNVTIEKTDLSVYPISQGGMVEFQLNITNEGNTTLDPVEVIDTLPVGFTYNNSNLTPDTILGQVITWNNIGPILGGDSVLILVNATVDLTTTSGFYTNNAEVEAQPSIGPNVTNASSVIVTVNVSAIDMIKTGVRLAPPYIVNFTLNITNTGEVPLTPWVEDTLPADLVYTVGESIPLPDNVVGQTLYWDTSLPVLAPGDSLIITYNVTVVGSGTTSNDASVDGVPPNGYNVSANASVVIITPGGGTSTGGGDNKPLEIEVGEPAYVFEEVTITVTVSSSPFDGAEVKVKTTVPGYPYWYYPGTTDSNGEVTFTPVFVGEHIAYATTDEAGYDDADSEDFEVLESVEGECITDSDCGECYVCEHHEDPADNQCVLEEGADCGVDADCPPKPYYKEPYKEGSDVPFDGDLYYIPDPEVDEAPEDHMGIQLYACIDCNCEPVECLTTDDCGEGCVCEDNECICEEEPDIPPECTSDDDCEDDEYCSDGGDCIDLDCVCGYPLNHACVFYECCMNETCWRLYDYNYFCNLELHECEEIPPEEEGDQPLETEIPDEGDVGDPVIIIVTSDGDPVPGADVIIVIDGTPYGMGKTDENGELEFIPEQPGDYLVQVSKEGFASAEDQFVALSGETIWDVIIRGVWIALFILLLIAILYVLASRRKKRRAKDQEE